jgi:hypothetical protein
MKMGKKEKYILKCFTGGFTLSFKHILYIAAYWAVVTFIIFLLITPFSAAVNQISGSSDISADVSKNPDLKAYFMIDILPDLSGRISSGLNPAIIVSGCLLAFAVGVFFIGGFLESFKHRLSANARGMAHSKKPKPARVGDFIHGGWKNFLTMLMFFLLGATGFLLLNTVTSSVGQFLKAVAWGMTESEAAAYFTGLTVRIIYYALFFYFALYLQYVRIAAVFGDEYLKDVRLRSVMRFKEGLWRGYDFLSDNKLKAACLFLIILAMTAAWFVLDHLVFFYITENNSFDPLLWSALTGLGYIFFRILQYAVAAFFFLFNLKD